MASAATATTVARAPEAAAAIGRLITDAARLVAFAAEAMKRRGEIAGRAKPSRRLNETVFILFFVWLIGRKKRLPYPCRQTKNKLKLRELRLSDMAAAERLRM